MATKIHSLNVYDVMFSNNINSRQAVCADAFYNIPDKNWLLIEFQQSLKSFLDFFGLKKWEDQNNDCDDFARAAAYLAQILHSRTPGREKGTALAVGEFHYIKENPKGAHAINFAIVKNPDLKLVFFEPQTGEELILTQAEKESCYYWRV